MSDVALDSPQVASYSVYRCRVKFVAQCKEVGTPARVPA